MKRYKIAHIINPVIVTESSDLFVAQPITFETMRIAQKLAQGDVDVALYSAQYSEDHSIIPKWFQVTPDLDRSILDIGSFQKKRKLPLVKDILNNLYQHSEDADYLIYTNVDIAVMPNFYITVNKLINAGYDAFVINRRSISDRYQSITDIPSMYSDAGESHPGHDCFVFRKDVYPQYRLGSVCIGINWVGRALIYNLACHAKNFKEFKNEHLTFHIGNNKVWKNDEYIDYVAHNKNELLNILTKLEKQYGPFDRKEPLFSYITDVKLCKHIYKSDSLLMKLANSVKKLIGICER